MRGLLIPLACVLLATAACTTDGTPTAQTTSGSASPTTTPTSSRPRALDLAGKRACELVTDDQLAQLKIDRAGRPIEIEALNATGCTWTVTGISSIVTPVLGEGIGVWTDGKRVGKGESVAPVAGFPTITVPIPGSPDRCDLMIDTADNQYLAVAFTVSRSFQDRFPKPCDGARQLAEAAMQNLLK